ncbi:LysR family transcriptional regulator [Asticcacaulis taihuensis]|uniref:DNA-binding transcriptional regulator, LysR family n=1 Tax=Asticcacaulis taihuensis TaxID=260084 RepID=A0A1G4TPF3_9CAUL|nr:LysR family transcriptional regulator [Asticcacaulis taihuensis]SCW82655.1 DNA-binding transcriptional regulator, LysR family [Asticcacaulis taihuensis]
MMDVNLRQIRAFLAVVGAGSFTRAAELISLSQPALTVRVRQLEEQVGVRLIDRGARVLQLTREGRELYPVFQRMIRDFDAAIADVTEFTDAEQGIVRIAALPSFCTGPLASLFVDFKTVNPGLSFILRDAVGKKIAGMVRAEEVDFGIGVEGEREGDLEYIDLCQDRLMLVMPTGHPLALQDTVTLADVAAHPLVMMDRETSVRRMVDEAFAASGLSLKPACEATYMATAVSMVRAGLGVTLLPSSAAEINIYPDVLARAVTGEGMTRKIVIIKRPGVRLRTTADALYMALLGAALPKAFNSEEELGYSALPKKIA